MAPYFPLIDSDELQAKLNDAGLVILDCRFNLLQPDWGRQVFLQGHIPGAVYMDLALDLSGPVMPGVTGRHPLPHPEVLLASLRAAGVHADTEVVAYDQGNGMFAARAWWLLTWLGHRRTALLDGGLAAWTANGQRQMDNTWPPPRHTAWNPAPDDAMIVVKEDVRQMPQGLVDSRDHIRFTGEYEPIDPIGGHIPNAVCMPFQENLRADGTWKPVADLQDRFRDVTPAPDDASPVFYCGSGVSACHNIFAYALATGRLARLYAGSWSEWINYFPPVTGDA